MRHFAELLWPHVDAVAAVVVPLLTLKSTAYLEVIRENCCELIHVPRFHLLCDFSLLFLIFVYFSLQFLVFLLSL